MSGLSSIPHDASYFFRFFSFIVICFTCLPFLGKFVVYSVVCGCYVFCRHFILWIYVGTGLLDVLGSYFM